MAFRSTFLASLEKIQAVAAHGQVCFTSGVEPVIRAWNIVDNKCIGTYKVHAVEVTALLSIRDGTVLISAQSTAESTVVKKCQVNAEVRALAHLSLRNEDYIAVGYVNGMIRIEQLDPQLKMTTVYEMFDQEEGIHTLAWQSLPDQTLETHPRWPLLASSTRRLKHIRLWHIPTESLCSTILPSQSNAQWTDKQKTTLWVEMAWSPQQQDIIYISTHV
ncbi:hypothetical protein BDF14DRAFT_1741700 [Spinellus fusiger]|nr:hypothetical protein BDF14DRAFT_1741700 [Spinellus fusiger]